MEKLYFYKKKWIEEWACCAIKESRINDFYRILDTVNFINCEGDEICTAHDLIKAYNKTIFGPLINIG